MLCVLAGGGFGLESTALLATLQYEGKIVFLFSRGNSALENLVRRQDAFHDIPSFSNFKDRSITRDVTVAIRIFFITLRAIFRHRTKILLCVGTREGVPALVCGRLLRTSNIFVESITRSRNLSNTGWIVYFCRLADLFIVQWPRMADTYERAKAGTIL